ncbi:TetR/AcrR family transcriptional regulator [Enterovibrio nigricans]|uniref:Transcriptional regulator, TetR family n=1 Tax=Enterovibrio nigricans DSM 22720 TaxID=1121868 RepID=A0A1T4VH42_9GAMM|nr:TetR/AcrR family transcriptional regulator [Enterovibrio nigricans]PKF49573.1 TetR/AcrR family transcriptional regulator [Enterovibrio nigricans]SKA64243.1 transcriptional regulator, TetR family [Enterovibrio nigricans DSM 22720]
MTRSEKKRLSIITAAKEEFIQHGFIAANMDRVCTAAEVSKRTLYRHFESKEVLFEAVLMIIQAAVDENLQYPFDANKSLHDQLTEISLMEAKILYQTYGIPLSRTIVMAFLRQPDLARSVITKLYSKKAVTQWFAAAIEAGKLKDIGLKEITNIYTSLFQGTLFWPQVFEMQPVPMGKELDEKIEHLVCVVLGACGN